jgi:glycosyltransferase involved in cell wall biosynthesis
LERDGIEVLPLSRRPGFRPLLAARIAKYATEWRADVVHCHEYSPFVYGALSQLINPSVRIISTEHGRLSDAPATLKRRLGTRLVNLLPAQVFAVSDALRRELIREGFPAHRVRVIHNGIDPGPVPSPHQRTEARERLALPPGELVIGTLGRLVQVKDFETLLLAFGLLRRRGVRCRLVVVGDGPERARLIGCTRAAGLCDRVRFESHRDDARALLPAFDVFVNSSLYEGISLSILEAMAAALPVVATRVGGTPEVVQDGATGLLVPHKSPQELAAALAVLAADETLRRQQGGTGRTRVLQKFDIAVMLQAYTNAYRLRRAPGGGAVASTQSHGTSWA